MTSTTNEIMKSLQESLGGMSEESINVLDLLKKDLIGEYDAVSQYEEHLKKVPQGPIKDKLQEIMKEELHHIKELTDLIKQYQN